MIFPLPLARHWLMPDYNSSVRILQGHRNDSVMAGRMRLNGVIGP